MTEKTDFYVGPVIVENVAKHENADTLSICTINGNPVIFRTGDFNEGDRAIYLSVDAVVPTDKPQFKFLAKAGKTTHRIKAVRLRGVFSMGLLIPIKGLENSADVMANLGVTKYVPPSEREDSPNNRTTVVRKAPKLPVYGLYPMRKYGSVLLDDEEVVITEKIHGTNSRYVFIKNKLWVGSHKVMRGSSRGFISEFFNRIRLKIIDLLGFKHRAHLIQDQGDVWWKIAGKYDLKDKLKNYPNMIVYGEIYGKGIQDMEYGVDSLHFRVFDIYDMKNDEFLDFNDCWSLADKMGLPFVPVLKIGRWSELKDWAHQRAEGKSAIADHLIEGVVVKPTKERIDPKCGRVALKLVGQQYLLRKTDD